MLHRMLFAAGLDARDPGTLGGRIGCRQSSIAQATSLNERVGGLVGGFVKTRVAHSAACEKRGEV